VGVLGSKHCLSAESVGQRQWRSVLAVEAVAFSPDFVAVVKVVGAAGEAGLASH